ncbi:DUF1796 family putative cysteine peptidase [Burkholderia cenocepacia]|uniref:DUF1796 family putative cysteine peptidase n=1 Tax=Burkholderia cenocepacia TaxID=95486 RepID=UPI0019050C98|nr:DUF1796 family putative cysteine peptidase [Burkholderia cenocepacia]MBJ9695769.1 hypothetical protein [Burkholderia cenocepacia]
MERNDRDRKLIEALYIQILGRAGDEGGIGLYMKTLVDHPRDDAILNAVRTMMGSEEYQKRVARERIADVADVVRHAINPHGSELINGLPVSHIVSLGTHCITSFLLKKYGLKRYSLPFDWVFSSPEAVMHCLDDNFVTFLDGSHYRSITEERETKEPGASHTYYLERYGVINMFAHRDPTRPADYAYTKKTVARLGELLPRDDAKLFVMTSRPVHDMESQFDTIAAKVDTMTKNGALLAIQLEEPTEQPGCHSMTFVRQNGNHKLYRFKPSSSENGKDFEETIDDAAIIRLICQYSLDLVDTIPVNAAEAQHEA